jgi:type II secretory pathway component GspD/PulD (secretin)
MCASFPEKYWVFSIEKCMFLLGMLFSMAVVPGVCRAETVVIPIHYRSAAEVLPIVKGILSPAGQITFADSVHALVVTDTAASLQQVYTFLETLNR